MCKTNSKNKNGNTPFYGDIGDYDYDSGDSGGESGGNDGGCSGDW